jgi:peptidoglycan hydrolase CwlO-like protein
MKRLSAVCVVILSLAVVSLAGVQTAQSESEPVVSAQGNQKLKALVQELKQLQEGLAAKEAELATLRHKWIVNKGRKPTKEELAEFEEKRKKGKLKPEDNPYINKSPLSSPARARAAYHEKKAEIEKDKARAALLQEQINALNPK